MNGLYFSFSTNHEKNFRTFVQNMLKLRHFELFLKSGAFYSIRSDPEPGSESFQRSDPDPVKIDQIRQHLFTSFKKSFSFKILNNN
jgi:hypothetical protein